MSKSEFKCSGAASIAFCPHIFSECFRTLKTTKPPGICRAVFFVPGTCCRSPVPGSCAADQRAAIDQIPAAPADLISGSPGSPAAAPADQRAAIDQIPAAPADLISGTRQLRCRSLRSPVPGSSCAADLRIYLRIGIGKTSGKL